MKISSRRWRETATPRRAQLARASRQRSKSNLDAGVGVTIVRTRHRARHHAAGILGERPTCETS